MTIQEEIENLFKKYLSVCVDYNDLKIYDKNTSKGVDIDSWVKAYDDFDIDCPNRCWKMERKTVNYDIEKINDICFFELNKCFYTKNSKNRRIKRLLSHCNEKSRENAYVYIIQKLDKIYISIDKY